MSPSGAGVIVSGTSAPGLRQQKQIGSSELGQELQKARRDPKVKAVVLRVDSPGWQPSLKSCLTSKLMAYVRTYCSCSNLKVHTRKHSSPLMMSVLQKRSHILQFPCKLLT